MSRRHPKALWRGYHAVLVMLLWLLISALLMENILGVAVFTVLLIQTARPYVKIKRKLRNNVYDFHPDL